MRSTIVFALSAVSILATVTLGNAQDNQRSSNPPLASGQSAKGQEDNFWPSPAQERAIPYRACNADAIDAKGHHVCLSDN
jgi:hypothetical protein